MSATFRRKWWWGTPDRSPRAREREALRSAVRLLRYGDDDPMASGVGRALLVERFGERDDGELVATVAVVLVALSVGDAIAPGVV